MLKETFSTKDQLRFESLLTELSARFINLPAQHVDAAIEDAQRQVCECLGLNLSAVFLWESHEPDVFIMTHLYRPLGGPEVPERMSASEFFPWSFNLALSQEVVVVPSVENAPPEAAVDQASWRHYEIKAVVSFALATGDLPTFGVIGFCDVSEEREWSEELIHRLELVAQVFANALARKKAEQALQLSEQRLQLAAGSAGAGLWSMDLATERFWITPAIREMHGYTPDEEVTWERFFELVHPEDREVVQDTLDSILKNRAEGQVEYRITVSGQTRWLLARGRLHCEDEDLSACAVMGVTVDVTERKKSDERLRQALEEVSQLRDRLEMENVYLREQLQRDDGQDAIVGESEPVLRMISQARQVATTDSTVLVTGETGTGKELLAQAIHNLSHRKSRAMVKVNCAALPAPLIEGELFGREKGAYTGAMTRQSGRFEVADGSTIFLDEIGDLPLELQAKLLRVLQSGQFERLGSHKTLSVDVRIIAATNHDLAAMVREGRFREDLFHRLNVFPIEIPPLRDRDADIPMLTWKFVHEFNEKMGKLIDAIPAASMNALKQYPWPGNVRELRNLVERAAIISTGRTLQIELPSSAQEQHSVFQTMEEMERAHIFQALEQTEWRIRGDKGAAVLLDLVPTTLHSRMKKLGIVRPAR